MNEVELKNLNEKIARWLGWKYDNQSVYWLHPTHKYPLLALPDYVNDSNAQIKDIYPELKKRRMTIEIKIENFYKGKEFCHVDIHQWQGDTTPLLPKIYHGNDLNPTVAFALAVEKYINSLEKK